LSPTLIAQIAATIAKLSSNNEQDKLKPKSTPSTPKKSEPIPNNTTNKEFSSKSDGGTSEEDEDNSENKKTPKGKKGQEKPNPCYYVNPHISKSNKINSTKHNRFLYNYLA
jgi:hypothetical protein